MLENYELDKLGVLNREFHFYIYSFCPNNFINKKYTGDMESIRYC